MSEATRYPLAQMQQIAAEVVELFRPYCTKIEVAGSIRREKPTCKDIEIVLEPIFEPTGTDLFGNPAGHVNRQYAFAADLRNQGILTDRLSVVGQAAFGERYQRVAYKGIPLDTFCIFPPSEWGVQLAIRTGPDHFNKAFVLQWAHSGTILSPGMQIKDGALYDKGKLVPTPTEQSFFNAIGFPYLKPSERDNWEAHLE